MPELIGGLLILVTPAVLVALVLGVTAGFAIGILPGFGGGSAAAVVLPFALLFPIETVLAFLIGIYVGSQFGGSIPAILLNVPGTGSDAATALDGYPMTQAGQAERAIGIARTASVIGGAMAALLCLALLPLLGRVAIQFGSIEMLLIGATGLTIVATIVGDDPVKGLVAALLGISVSLMASDPITGNPRFTFDRPELFDQIPFIPVVIGGFAIAQMLVLSGQRTPIAQLAEATSSVLEKAKRSTRDFLGGIRATLSYPRDLVRSILISVGIGVIPGAGTSISTFASYAAARRASKTPERFGKGAEEGVLASEASDSATAAGTLVPTLTLGIPGGATSAIMLSAMIAQGIPPGPRFMAEHAPQAYSVLLGILLASLLILPLSLLLAVPMSYITRVNPSVLVPVVMVVGLIGAFASRGYMFDMTVALIVGVGALLMRVAGYPIVPLIFGFILGPMIESNFLRSLRLGDNDPMYFLLPERPIAKVLWVLFIAAVAFNVMATVRQRRRRSAKVVGEQPTSAHRP